MKLRVHTFGKEIGQLDLAKGATIDDVRNAMQRHQLWITDEPSPKDAGSDPALSPKGAAKDPAKT